MAFQNVRRLDSIPLTSAYFTKEGYLRDKPIVTTCGIFEYEDEDGSTHKELRLPEEVFDPESLASYKGKPIIFTHDAGEIDKDNVAENGIGTILSKGIKDGDKVRAEIVIHDTGILQRGLRELSLGYSADLEEEPGEWNGEHYDCIQHNIRINHLALVDEARAGHEARLNLDSKKTKKGGNTKVAKKKRSKMNFDSTAGILTPEELSKAIEMYLAANENTEILDDEAPAIEEPVEDIIEEIRERADRRDAEGEDVEADPKEMQEDIRALLDRIDELAGAEDMEKEDDDESEDDDIVVTDEDEEENEELALNSDDDEEFCPEKEDDDEDEENTEPNYLEEDDEDTEESPVKMDSIDKRWAEMYSICQMANALGLKNFVPRSVMDGKKKIVKTINPKIKLDGKSKGYIDGAYSVAVSTAMQRKTVSANMKKVLGRDATRFDSVSNVGNAESARRKMISNLKKGGR